MGDVSNRTIVALLAVALVVTVVGTGVSISKLSGLGGTYSVLSGAATSESGESNLTVYGIASMDVTDTVLDLGTGYYDDSCAGTQEYAEISSNGSTPTCWLASNGSPAAATTDYHTLENDGTLALRINISNIIDGDGDAGNGTDFFCGDGVMSTNCHASRAVFMEVHNDFNGETSYCSGGTANTAEDIFPSGVNTNLTDQSLCTYTSWAGDEDEFNVSYIFRVPRDARSGEKQLTITYSAESAE